MKIVMLGQKRMPSREGGVEVVVEELSTRMAALGHDVTCLNRRSKKDAFDIDEYEGVKIKRVITIDKRGLAAMTSSFFASIKALFSGADVVHYHAEGPCAMMWIIKWFSRKRVIATIHGLDWQRSKWGGFATKYIKFGEKVAVKYADEIIVLSENVKKYFKDTYNRETVFIPNGVNKPVIVKADIIKKEFGLNKDDYILFEEIAFYRGISRIYNIVSMAFLQATLINEFSDRISISAVHVQSWKSKVLGNRSAKKEDAVAFIESKYPQVDLDIVVHHPKKGDEITKDNDTADAICIGLYGSIANKKKLDEKLVNYT